MVLVFQGFQDNLPNLRRLGVSIKKVGWRESVLSSVKIGCMRSIKMCHQEQYVICFEAQGIFTFFN